jgi:tellurium resistance protein TerD
MSEVEITRSASIVSDPSLADVFILKRGEMANLTRMDPTLKRIMVGVGWDVIGFEGEAPDLDVSMFMLDKNDKTAADEDFVFYNNLKNADGSVEHMGDNRTGAGDGDDENIRIDLMLLPFDVRKVAFSISIYEAPERGHSFRSVRNCFLRIVNEETGIELMRFNLDAEFLEAPESTAVLVGMLNREGPNWFFEGVGRLEQGGLAKFATEFGIVVAL